MAGNKFYNMDNSILFYEKQHFRQWWLWLLIIACSIIPLIFMMLRLADGRTIDRGNIFALAIMLAVGIFFYILKLETYITSEGIYIRFFPFRIKFRYYAWRWLQKIYIRKYAPIKEYGGWGLRYGFRGKGMAYNVSGNMGLQLAFIDGQRFLIGTQRPVEWKAALEHLGQYKP